MILARQDPAGDPPEPVPELLLVARVGGGDDQGLDAVQVKGSKITASGGLDFKCSVEVLPDGALKSKAWGNLNAKQDPQGALPHIHSGKLGQIEFGFNQVAPLLQQPFMKAPGWQLWGWTEAQARKSKAKYAPFMADSGIRMATLTPSKTLYAVGLCDGGNTCLRADPRDIDSPLEFPVALGGGAGQSSYAFEISQKGELLRQLVVRGSANGVCWDDWGRTLVVGRGIVRGDDADAHKTFGYGDGAGLVLVDRDWKKVLFKASFGTEGKGGISLWAADIDSKSGLAAVVGHVEGTLRETAPIQPKAGGGKDGFIAVFRLWPSREKK